MGAPTWPPTPPQRSEHPGEAVALLDGEARARTAVTPAAPMAPAEPALEPGQSDTSLATPPSLRLGPGLPRLSRSLPPRGRLLLRLGPRLCLRLGLGRLRRRARGRRHARRHGRHGRGRGRGRHPGLGLTERSFHRLLPVRQRWLALALPCRPLPASAREKLERDSPPDARRLGGERGVGPDGERRASEQRAHGTAGNLDRRRDRERIRVGGERGKRRPADQEGPRAREPHPPLETRDRERVAPRDVIVGERAREKPPIEWAHAGSGAGLEEVLRDEAESPEVGRGQVTAAVSEVARDVAEHVGHLERLAEAHARSTLLARVPAPEPWAVGDAERRPEGADAAGDEVRVAVELVERVERG